MKCPHCLVEVHESWSSTIVSTEMPGRECAIAEAMVCPACARLVVRLRTGHFSRAEFKEIAPLRLVFPRTANRAPAPPEVDDPSIREDYQEACLILADSPKASAALGRRCLQNLLRTKAGVNHGNLADEIKEVLDRKVLPSLLADNVDAIRQIGNFAAHPMKSSNIGEILPVEPDEAEWTLDVLEGLFDHYYVQPARALVKRTALDKKLAEAGKPPMKKP